MRTFLSITPDAQSAIAIERWASLCWPAISRPVSLQNYHMTLAFLGEINDSKLLSLQELLDQGRYCAFELPLNAVGYWPESATLWLGPADVPKALYDLAAGCKKAANRTGIKVGSKRYQPHLTLARKTQTPPGLPLIEPDFNLRIDSFQLYHSILNREGVRYSELNSWDLDQ